MWKYNLAMFCIHRLTIAASTPIVSLLYKYMSELEQRLTLHEYLAWSKMLKIQMLYHHFSKLPDSLIRDLEGDLMELHIIHMDGMRTLLGDATPRQQEFPKHWAN